MKANDSLEGERVGGNVPDWARNLPGPLASEPQLQEQQATSQRKPQLDFAELMTGSFEFISQVRMSRDSTNTKATVIPAFSWPGNSMLLLGKILLDMLKHRYRFVEGLPAICAATL